MRVKHLYLQELNRITMLHDIAASSFSFFGNWTEAESSGVGLTFKQTKVMTDYF